MVMPSPKEQLFLDEIDKSKERQSLLITQYDNEIAYFQTQIAMLEQRKKDAQDLLNETETRYPTEVT